MEQRTEQSSLMKESLGEGWRGAVWTTPNLGNPSFQEGLRKPSGPLECQNLSGDEDQDGGHRGFSEGQSKMSSSN